MQNVITSVSEVISFSWFVGVLGHDKFIKNNVIAWPVGYFVMSRWLQNFAYRTSIGLWVFIFSAMLALGIVLVTVSFQAA